MVFILFWLNTHRNSRHPMHRQRGITVIIGASRVCHALRTEAKAKVICWWWTLSWSDYGAQRRTTNGVCVCVCTSMAKVSQSPVNLNSLRHTKCTLNYVLAKRRRSISLNATDCGCNMRCPPYSLQKRSTHLRALTRKKMNPTEKYVDWPIGCVCVCVCEGMKE